MNNSFFVTVFLILGLCMLCTADQAAQNARDSLIEAANKFSINSFSDYALRKPDSNFIISPLSVWIALSMLAFGSGGNTYEQMKNSLFLPEDSEGALKGFKLLQEELNGVKDFDLNVHNKLYVSDGFKVEDGFLNMTKTAFDAETSSFDNLNSEKAAYDINKWISDATHDKIKDLVKKSDISKDLAMLLLNAVYFKGEWKTKFNNDDTSPRPFHYRKNGKDVKKLVPTMSVTSRFLRGHVEDLNAEFIELPYTNEEAKMKIIVPDSNSDLQSLLNNKHALGASLLKKSGSRVRLDLSLPKFKIESEIDLKEPLQRLGMTDMFDGRADFSKISNERLRLSKIKQKAFVDVTEWGTEATAVNVLMMQPMSLPGEFKVDRPSLFVIMVKNIIIFIGCLEDPTL